ncbi:MAG: glycerate kinase [Clostridia bacterium]|nr:glycerate kinase [Clostridia bacterium]
MGLREDAGRIVREAIGSVLPGPAVMRAVKDMRFAPEGRVILIAVGKAAWDMAASALEALPVPADSGMVITKYGHARGMLKNLEIREAGHPVPDENGYRATARALELVKGLSAGDTVLFLLSGGGSALFEAPLVPPEEMEEITRSLLSSGADIKEINTVRKRLSAVKGGRFALACAPAKVKCVILSDVLGDRIDTIASGPACPDDTTCAQAQDVIARYGIRLSCDAQRLIRQETPKRVDNAEHIVIGSVRQLCEAAAAACRELGYETKILETDVCCEAREAGRRLAREAVACQSTSSGKHALVMGGETVVKVTGKGLGGRNQELALAAAFEIDGRDGLCVFSVGSDGTDGPTDAAGGYADGSTAEKLRAQGIDIKDVLMQNDSYHALKAADGLIVTGPTGTNVNDVSVVLIV